MTTAAEHESQTYHGPSRLIAASGYYGSAHSQSFTLDALGNMSSITTGGTTQNRTYNSENQLTYTGSSTSLTYDNNGNMTRDHQGRTTPRTSVHSSLISLYSSLHRPTMGLTEEYHHE
jgi:hypothetical protein